jgi:flagellar biogenesis protein FliO
MDVYFQLLSVCAVGAVAALAWWLRRGGPLSYKRDRPARWVEVVERVHLTPQHSIHVVRVGECHVVLAVHGSAVTVIERLSASSAQAAGCGFKRDAKSADLAAPGESVVRELLHNVVGQP